MTIHNRDEDSSEDATKLQREEDQELPADNEEGDEEGGLQGRRLQLIPHEVDPRYVFRFEFGPAILAQVLEKIQELPRTPLAEVSSEMAPYPGFYQLFRGEDSVYVGRTIRPVAVRLREHMRKLRGRVPLGEMSARFLFVEDLSLVGLSEDALIAYFYPLGLDPWGKMGFGSKATGFGRAGQVSAWHAANPADLTHPVIAGHPQPRTLRQLVSMVARGAPLVLSVPRQWRDRLDAEHDFMLEVPREERPFGEWVDLITKHLRPGWSIRREAMAWYIVGPEEVVNEE